MGQPAAGNVRYGRYFGDTVEKARARARDDAAALSAEGWEPYAERWDGPLSTLVVAFRTASTSGAALPGGEWSPVTDGYANLPSTRTSRRKVALSGVGALAIAALVIAALQVAGTSEAGPAEPSTRPGTAGSPSADEAAPRFEEGACRGAGVSWDGVRCGDLVVLEDRSKPEGRHIRLHVAIVPAMDPSDDADPVVYLEGGPGGSALTDGIGLAEFSLAAKRDVIVFDQRGMGTSEPSLTCLEPVMPWWDVAALSRCRARLIREGSDLGAYNTTASAADVEDLRTVLGYEQWNVYGVSYGSRLALAVMRDYPAGMRSAILDSVYPMGIDGLVDQAPNAQRAFDELFAGCAADAACAAAYPDLEDHFYALARRFDSIPRPVRLPHGFGDVQVDTNKFLWLVFERMYVTDYLPSLPASLERFWLGDLMELDRWIEEAYVPGTGRLGRAAVAIGAYHSIECAETLPFADQARLGIAAPGVQPVVADAFDWQLMVDRCAVWDVPPASDAFNVPVASDAPTLLLAGTYDPVTPPAWATVAAQTLDNHTVVVVPGVGHGVAGTSACIDGVIAHFLEEPSKTPQTECVDELEPPVFDVP